MKKDYFVSATSLPTTQWLHVMAQSARMDGSTISVLDLKKNLLETGFAVSANLSPDDCTVLRYVHVHWIMIIILLLFFGIQFTKNT